MLYGKRREHNKNVYNQEKELRYGTSNTVRNAVSKVSTKNINGLITVIYLQYLLRYRVIFCFSRL
jgi:hypothetical protein